MSPPGDSGGGDKAAVFGPERRALTVGILLAITAFAVEGMGVVPALPTAVRELGGLPLFGWAFSAFMLAWMVGTVSGGQLADARGPRLPMAFGLVAFGAGLLCAGAAHGMAQFLVGRALQGSGGGAMIASAYVAIARGYPDAMRPRMMALTSSVWILPAVVGPALSGAIAQWVGWRYVFFGIVPLLALTALLVLPPLRRFDVTQPLAGTARLVAALRVALGSALVLASPLARPWGWAATVGVGAIGFALLAPALGALLPAGTLRARRGLPAGLAARALLAFSFFGTEAFVPLASGVLRGAAPTDAGLALTAGAIGWVTASWAQDRLEARRGAAGRPRRVGWGFALVAAGILLVAVTLLTALPIILIPIGWAIGGAGIGLAYAAGGLVCIAAAPAGQEGEVSGQLQLAEALSTASATGIGGALVAALAHLGRTPRQAYPAVFATTLAAALIGAAMAGRLGAKRVAAKG